METTPIVRGETRIERPITIGPYHFHATGIDIIGRPSFQQHAAAGAFAKRAHKRSGWWLADWLRYGDSRDDWQSKIDQVVDSSELSEKTAKNVRAIGAIPKSRRRETVDFSTHGEVAALEADEQVEFLNLAEERQLSQRDLRLAIRASRRRKVIDGQAVLEGMFRVLYADPPWIYGDRPPSGSGAEQHYPGLSIEELCRLPVAAHTTPDAVLFLWVTAPLMLANPGPREVGEAWGFTYKQQWVWDKVDRNFGHYSNGNHEVLTIWTRGSCLPDNPHDLPDSVIPVKKSNVHSAKPEEFRQLITRHWTQGPYLELFGRNPAKGWTVFGNDAKLWHQDAERRSA